jgi:hypothetical protein
MLGIETELNLDQPETYRINTVGSTSIRVSGGDLRGLMYGLIDAAEQMRAGGIKSKTAKPGFETRAIRIAPSDGELAGPTFYLSDRWIQFFTMLGRHRINQVTLVLPLTRIEPDRVRFLSQLALDHAVDLHVGIRGPLGATSLRAPLRKLLEECVLVRGIQVEIGRETVDYFRAEVFPAFQTTGRRVVLDLRGGEARPDILRAAIAAGIPLDIASRTAAGALSKPFHAVIPAQNAATEVAPVRERLAALATAGATGFEVELPGPNIEGYERLYWAWGRTGYDYVSPTLSTGKSAPKSGRK